MEIIEPRAELNPQQTTLLFNGERYITSGLGSNTTSVCVARIDVPQGASGVAQLKVNEYKSPAGQKRMWLSKTKLDFSGTGPYNPMASLRPAANIKVGGTPDATKVCMQPGETWYVMVKNESNYFGKVVSSCSGVCDIALKLSVLS